MGNDVRIRIDDHSREVERAIEEAIDRALEKMGLVAEGHAKLNLERSPRRIDTGRLRNSITHVALTQNGKKQEYIGTAVEYGKYVEYGTGIYVEDGTGRSTPWVYRGDDGKFHRTRGMEPNHFLKNAATEHRREYQQILRDEVDAATR